MINPIVPPPDLVNQWLGAYFGCTFNSELSDSEHYITTQAAQWGADQELEACVAWLDDTDCEDPQEASLRLRWHRRPKPPRLKEQALEALQFVDEKLDLPLHNHCNAIHTIRRALETLDD